MKAYQIISESGGIDALNVSEVAEPTPDRNEVLVRVRASSVNSRDLSTVENPGPRNLKYPCIPNSDGAGGVIGYAARFCKAGKMATFNLQTMQAH